MKKEAYDFWINQFSTGLNLSIGWEIKARQLFQSAWALLELAWCNKQKFEEIKEREPKGNGIEATPELNEIIDLASNEITISMLVAYGFENLLAAAYLTKPENCKEPKDRVPSEIAGRRGHDLLHLFETCKIEVTENEREALAVLSEASLWRGKYQFPKKDTQYAELIRQGKRGFSITSRFPEDIGFPEEIDSLFQKVTRTIQQNKKGEPVERGQ